VPSPAPIDLSSLPPSVAVPPWLRRPGPQFIENPRFLSGAALVLLDRIARGDHTLSRLWRQRLALKAAVHAMRYKQRTEDETALRDAFYFRKVNDDPGPAGNNLMAWRSLGTHDALSERSLWSDVLQHRLELPKWADITPISHPPTSAGPRGHFAGAMSEIIAILPPHQPFAAIWLSDMLLAASFNWTAPVPLLAGHIRHGDLKASASLPDIVSRAYTAAALEAVDLFNEIKRAALTLAAAASSLRSKAAIPTIKLLLCEDAVRPADGKAASARANRRIFERLHELGAVRELTGRPTFRLYGI